MFSKILIANRGEVAVRIIRACQEMSIPTVAVYSDVDERLPYVGMANEAVSLGDPLPAKMLINPARKPAPISPKLIYQSIFYLKNQR